MDPKRRIVTSMPLTVIWNQDGELNAERICDVGVEDIKIILRQGSTQFVVADVGSSLDWIHPDLSIDFWKTTAKKRIVSPEADGFALEDYPDEYCYCAALWKTQGSTNIIVLETHH